MSTKKITRTPTSGKKGKQNVKKSPHSSKTIDSFFNPVSNRSLCRSNNITILNDNTSSIDSQHNPGNDEVISPSPQKAKIGKGKDNLTPIKPKQSHILDKRKKSPRLKLKRKSIQRIVFEDTSITISSDSDEHSEVSTVKLNQDSSTNLGENSCSLSTSSKNDPEMIVCPDSDEYSTCVNVKPKLSPETKSDSSILNGDIRPDSKPKLLESVTHDGNLVNILALSPIMDNERKFQSRKLKLKRKTYKNVTDNSCNINESFNNENEECADEFEPENLTLKYQIKRKSSLSDDTTVINKKQQMDDSVCQLNEVETKTGDISDINFDDTFEGVDFDSVMSIPTSCVKPPVIDIDLSDSFLDVDLDAVCNNLEEDDVSVLYTWKVIEITLSSIHVSDNLIKEKVLILKSEDKTTDATCFLRGDWYFMELNIDDKVYVSGLSRRKTSCILDNISKHYLVTYPNTLISGTTIAAGITCERKAVLNERFKMDLQTNKAVFLGSLTHDLFDWVLQHKDCNIDDIETRAKENLNNPKHLEHLCILGLDINDIIEMQREYYLSLETWSKQFMRKNYNTEIDFKIGQEKGDDFMTQVHVDRVIDIEENVWSPYYGLKGKVDATVEVTIHRKPKLNNQEYKRVHTLPLEFKTGKLFSDLGSIDHRAQVAVYTLLMSERYKLSIDSGLLLYGKTNHMIGVPRPEQEKRAILIKRNEIARNLSLESKQLTLPPLIQKKRTCKRCDQNGTCMLYFKSMENGDAITSGVSELFIELTSHLSSEDLNYFAKWYELSILEASYDKKGSSDKYIWKKSADQREKDGKCFSGMINISFEQTSVDQKKLYKFKRKENHFNNGSLKSVPLGVGERVIISEENVKVFNITTGYITDVSFDILTVSVLNEVRGISRKNGITYRIDKDDTLSNYSTPLNNLSHLFKLNSSTDAKLRNLIIRGEKPQFSQHAGDEIKVCNVISDLNDVQRSSIKKCLSANDYVVIHGMPGAGKSTTIACLVQALVANEKSVLLTSYTHSAVDTILVKLLKVGFCDFVRIGQSSRVHPKILPYTYQEKTKSFTNVQHYKTFYREQNVVATTCLGINHAIFLMKHFDYCIVDEASQITQPVCIGPIRNADVFVLVGDDNQLPPLVINHEAKKKGLDCSLFQYLSDLHQDAVVTLNYQYRMNSSIMSLMNTLVYEDKMECANDTVADAQLKLPKYDELYQQNNTLQLWDIVNPKHPVVFVNTDTADMTEEKRGSFIVNKGEAILIKQIVTILIQCGLPRQDIGVISMYRHQVNLIRDELVNCGESVEVDTMDKYQGKDKDCIIVSFVRSNTNSEVGDLLKDWRRINVAMTRAKTKLVMIGSRTTIVNSEILCKLVDVVDTKGFCLNLEKLI